MTTSPRTTVAPHHSARLYTPLAVLFSLLWASAFIAVKFALRSSPPLFLMGFRFLLAGATLLVIAWLRGNSFPNSWRDWRRLAILGLLNNATYLGISAVALRSLSAGMGSVLASTMPLMLAAVAPFMLKERLGSVKMLGLLLAFVSVVTIMYSRVGVGDAPSSMALVLVANALLVTGTLLFKRWAPQHDLFVVTGAQLLFASVALLGPSLLLEPTATISWDLTFWAAITYLAFVVSCGATLIWLFLLRSGEASKASAFFFLNPVAGLFFGALLLGEPLRRIDFIGTTGVALGIYLVQRSKAV